jgi:hypothetical protein
MIRDSDPRLGGADNTLDGVDMRSGCCECVKIICPDPNVLNAKRVK